MKTVTQQFESAVVVMKQNPLLKMFNPGLGKFLVRRFAQIKGFPVLRTAKLFYGENMQVVLPEMVSEIIYTYGFFDEIVTGMVLDQIFPGDTVLDVGAHFGYFSLLFSHLAGETGRVYSFEPTPSTFDLLAANAGRKKNITVINSAIGSGNGRAVIKDFGLKYCAWNTLSFNSRMPGNLPDSSNVEVGVLKLDDYLERERISPNLIKIDAENFELDVVTGLEKAFLKGNPPKIIMEMGSDSSLKAGKLLHEKGYGVFVSDTPGIVKKWNNKLSVANLKYKDILFVR